MLYLTSTSMATTQHGMSFPLTWVRVDKIDASQCHLHESGAAMCDKQPPQPEKLPMKGGLASMADRAVPWLVPVFSRCALHLQRHAL
jgi:hypothetical protein